MTSISDNSVAAWPVGYRINPKAPALDAASLRRLALFRRRMPATAWGAALAPWA